MAERLSEIAETDAPPKIAAIYGEIRSASGLPIVNLVFRHMATMPGCLEDAWCALRPLYTHRALHAAAERIAGLAASKTSIAVARPAADPGAVRDTLESYIRGNTLNMIALFALTGGGSGENPGDAGAPFAPRPIRRLLPIADLSGLSRAAMAQLSALTRRTEGESPVVPSLYRHFIDRPEAVRAIEAVVDQVLREGLEQRATAMLEAAENEAACLSAQLSGEHRAVVERLARLFPPTMARMAIIAAALRKAWG